MSKILAAAVFAATLLAQAASHAQVGPLGAGPLPFSLSPATIAFTGTATSTASGSPSTFNSVNIGTPAANRYVACAVWGVNGSTQSSATINSVSATKLVERNNTGDVAVWIANVPTGTSVTISVTWAGSPNVDAGVGCWQLNGLVNAGAATATASGATNNSAITLSSVAPGGVVLAAAAGNATATCAVTWTGLSSHDYCFTPFWNFAGASQAFATAQTSYGVTANLTNAGAGTDYAAVAVSLR